jgi:hypothetical protein
MIDWEVGLDFCRTHIPSCDITRTVLRDIHEFGIEINIREKCWKSIVENLVTVQHMLEYIRNNASKFLNECSEHEAISEFNSQIIETSLLSEEIGVKPEQIPDENKLREAVREMGLRNFRGYIDDNLSLTIKAQNELDQMVTSKYTPSGGDPLFFEGSVKTHVNSGVDILVDTYKWARNNGDYLITPQYSNIYNNKGNIEGSMQNQRYSILSPDDIMAVAEN